MRKKDTKFLYTHLTMQYGCWEKEQLQPNETMKQINNISIAKISSHSPYLPAAIPTAAKMNGKLIARQTEDGVEKWKQRKWR